MYLLDYFWLFIVLVVGVVCGLMGASVYYSKGHERALGFLAGLFLGPLGLIITLVSPPDVVRAIEREEDAKLLSGEYERCPHCLELMRAEARACPHCQRISTPPSSTGTLHQ